MKLNNMFSNLLKKKKAKVVGRGIGCGKGKTSGRGHKGQKSRTGVSINGFEGGQQPIFTRLPKRGFNSLFKKEYFVVNIGTIQHMIDIKKIDSNAVINKELLLKAGLIPSLKKKVKILGGKGLLRDKIVVDCDHISKQANYHINSLAES